MLRSFGRLVYPDKRQDTQRGLAVSRRLCLCGFEGLQRVSLGLFAILFTGLERQGLGELNGNATEKTIYVIYATNMP